jgi:hemerythrin-like domain-containing protein
MLPIGPLMIEHRLIERLIADIDRRLSRVSGAGAVDPAYVDTCIDFIRTYADHCHHGKEEEILFRDLARKPLSPDLAALMDELVADHAVAREITGRLAEANARYAQGDAQARTQVVAALRELTVLYPLHIEKEDKRFFKPSMTYFSPVELEDMLRQFQDFDRRLIHDKYRQTIQDLEQTQPR